MFYLIDLANFLNICAYHMLWFMLIFYIQGMYSNDFVFYLLL